jgi:group I intron endonuclease
MYAVYMHVFPNGKRYIGITCQKPIYKRWNSTGGGYRHCPKMWKAIQKFGWGNVEHYVLFDGLNKPQAEAKEIELIKQYDSISNGYNIEHGGNVSGTHNEETKRKISLANKGKVVSEETREKLRNRKPLKGRENGFFGKHHSEETKLQHSSFMKGNQYNKGHHHTDEFKRMKSKQMHEKYSNGGNPQCKKVLMIFEDGHETTFYSLRNASEFVGVSIGTMHNYIKKGVVKDGNIWRYLDE